MELGEKLLRARQEAGLSQRQLCGGEITRNMLSQIEHGAARPSMATLQYLASRLGKPVSYFLEEDAVISPNQKVMADARRAWDAGDYAAALESLTGYKAPDEIFDREQQLLEALLLLNLAEQAMGEGRYPYSRELLERCRTVLTASAYPLAELERRRLLLLSRIPGEDLNLLCQSLPDLDEELLLRAQAALSAGRLEQAVHCLELTRDRESARWCLLRGQAFQQLGDYNSAARCFHGAENDYPKQAARNLEACYRELGDFKKAYYYACKQR